MPAFLAALLPSIVGGVAGCITGLIAGGIIGSYTYEWALAGECGCKAQENAMRMTKNQWIATSAVGAGIIGGVAGVIAGTGTIGVAIVSVAGVAISGYDIYQAYQIIKNETGITSCMISRILLDIGFLVVSSIGMQKAIESISNEGLIFSWSRVEKYPAIDPPRNRSGLRLSMGTPPSDLVLPQAHHKFPWVYREWFAGEGRGLNVNDPQYGSWVEGTPPGVHQNWSYQYEQAWGRFIIHNPNSTRIQVFQYLEQLINSGSYPVK